MNMQDAIRTVVEGRDLTAEEMTGVMETIMTGEATPAQIGGFLVGLRVKGETVEEIASAARVMRKLATPVKVEGPHLLDTCGTGGDGAKTFNISTASALVAAAAGARVAKHGNRSLSSSSGSADVLEAAGVKLDLSPETLARCIETVGVGFLFAPQHHGAMRHAIGPRREMAIRTVFNVLGPLTNPASADNQLLGVFSDQLVEPIAHVLQRLGSHHVLVVHSEDGLDEISIAGPTRVAELKAGEVHNYTVRPEDFGLGSSSLDTLRVASAAESLAMIQRVLAGEPGPARDIVALNGGAAIYAANLVGSLADGVTRAQALLDDGATAGVLERLIRFSQEAA